MSEEVNASVTDEDFHATVTALEGLPVSAVPISADAAKRHAAVTAFMIALCNRKETVTALTEQAKASITDIFSKLEVRTPRRTRRRDCPWSPADIGVPGPCVRNQPPCSCAEQT